MEQPPFPKIVYNLSIRQLKYFFTQIRLLGLVFPNLEVKSYFLTVLPYAV